VILISVIVVAAFAPSAAFAQTPTPVPGNEISGDQIIIGNTFRLESGEALSGNLLVIGGTATIADKANLNGDIVLVGGTISVSGNVNGDIVAVGGAVNLESYAVVSGGITLVGANLNRSPLAKVSGTISEQNPEIFNFDFNQPGGVKLPFAFTQNPLTKLLNTTLQALAMAVLAVILGLLLPNQLKRVSDTVVREPLIAGGVGLLTIIVAPTVLMLLVITILLIPVSLLGMLVLVLAIFYGFVAVGFEIGQRIAALFKTTWNPSISAGIGVLLLSLVTGYATFIPCIGVLIGIIVSIFGLGAVVISRFGSSKYAYRVVQAVMPTTPPQPPSTETPQK
jgi:cytoskeletal protein CcmA (bactofilin family)